MQLRGKIISISCGVAEVCIIREKTACENCSACPKKIGIHDSITVAAINGIQIGQEVVLRDARNWFTKNKMVSVLLAFVLGIILTDAISSVVSFGHYRTEIDLFSGGLITIITVLVLWIKRPRYLFKIALAERGRITYDGA